MTLRAHLDAARTALITAGIDTAEAGLDARLLASAVLGVDAAQVIAELGSPTPDGFDDRYGALVARRAAREPMAYILGRQEFWGRRFTVTPDVLIPRPETEIIVEAVLQRTDVDTAPLRIADVGTGSGCLAATLALERPRAQLVAIDLSADALSVARRNVSTLGVGDRIALVRGDLLTGTLGPFDVIVSNPPYVPVADRNGLPPEVGVHEPTAALFAGLDGLDVIRRLVLQAIERLAPRGWLIFEIGMGQTESVRRLVTATSGLQLEAIASDLQGIPRTAIARAR
jgi:release factor glutamine methyltransferase